jgi:4-azaleucine resistance transporter AzlC
MAMSLGVFAGASQLVALQMMAADHLPTVVVFTALLINLRLAIYSAAIAPYFHALSGFWKWPLAYLLTDQAFVVSIQRFEKNPQGLHRHWYYLGAALGLWMVWQLATACGALLGARILEDWPLDFAVAMIFLALLMPAIRDRATVAAALTAGLTAVLGTALPHGVGLALAALVGIAVGLWTEIQTERT